MGYPNVSTTQILPTTGSLALTEISSLSGNYVGGGVGPLTAPYKLSELGGQDTDIPTSPSPIKFSQFRGAVNYNHNYRLLLTNLGEGLADTYPLYYYTFAQNPYAVINLSNISRLLTLNTKGSSTNSDDTFVRRDAILNCSIAGYLDDGVTLWMQINNNVVATRTKLSGETTRRIDVPSNSNETLLNNILKGIDSLAPDLVTTLTNSKELDIFKRQINDKLYYTPSSILTKLNSIIDSVAGKSNQTYTVIGRSSPNGIYSFDLKTSTYEATVSPLCYTLGGMYHPARGQGWSSAEFTVKLEKYQINTGTPINLFIGAGPGAPRQGNIWGSTTLTVDITNTPSAEYPDP